MATGRRFLRRRGAPRHARPRPRRGRVRVDVPPRAARRRPVPVGRHGGDVGADHGVAAEGDPRHRRRSTRHEPDLRHDQHQRRVRLAGQRRHVGSHRELPRRRSVRHRGAPDRLVDPLRLGARRVAPGLVHADVGGSSGRRDVQPAGRRLPIDGRRRDVDADPRDLAELPSRPRPSGSPGADVRRRPGRRPPRQPRRRSDVDAGERQNRNDRPDLPRRLGGPPVRRHTGLRRLERRSVLACGHVRVALGAVQPACPRRAQRRDPSRPERLPDPVRCRVPRRLDAIDRRRSDVERPERDQPERRRRRPAAAGVLLLRHRHDRFERDVARDLGPRRLPFARRDAAELPRPRRRPDDARRRRLPDCARPHRPVAGLRGQRAGCLPHVGRRRDVEPTRRRPPDDAGPHPRVHRRRPAPRWDPRLRRLRVRHTTRAVGAARRAARVWDLLADLVRPPALPVLDAADRPDRSGDDVLRHLPRRDVQDRRRRGALAGEERRLDERRRILPRLPA